VPNQCDAPMTLRVCLDRLDEGGGLASWRERFERFHGDALLEARGQQRGRLFRPRQRLVRITSSSRSIATRPRTASLKRLMPSGVSGRFRSSGTWDRAPRRWRGERDTTRGWRPWLHRKRWAAIPRGRDDTVAQRQQGVAILRNARMPVATGVSRCAPGRPAPWPSPDPRPPVPSAPGVCVQQNLVIVDLAERVLQVLQPVMRAMARIRELAFHLEGASAASWWRRERRAAARGRTGHWCAQLEAQPEGTLPPSAGGRCAAPRRGARRMPVERDRGVGGAACRPPPA